MATRKTSTRKKTTTKKKVAKKDTKVAVRIVNPVLGKYNIVAEVGHVKQLHYKQAEEVVNNGDAEYIN